MGYLDGSSITVDALLTDLGRRKLAEHGNLGIQFYTFGDTGVDYNLYNPDHPSGSTSFGEAISRLPQLEANPSNIVSMRYTLTSMARNTLFVPLVQVTDETINDTLASSAVWLRPSTAKMDESGELYTITIYDASPLIFEKKHTKNLSAHIGKTGGHGMFLPNSQYSTVLQWSNVKELKVLARAIKSDVTVTYSAYGQKSGQIAYGQIKVIGTL
tara:strand:+ start:1611 stop:2252 length:642 start_codon:yes stop_codon:yes gene_type:complete